MMVDSTISHYKILDKLGEGGMGVVYKAQDTKLDRLVALKFLPQHLAASDQDKARLVQEAKAAAALNHPNVCSVMDIQEHDGQMFIVMEFVDGQALREKGMNIPLKQAIEIGVQLSEGLAAAHEKGIVHRDIKPENIMIRKDGRVLIMDFGLAKLKSASSASRLTKEGSTIGTVGYMSPEQVQGQDADHRTDIYSLGVLLYELIAGQSPYKGVHETAIMYEIVNEEPPPLSSIKPEIDPELDAMILDCMAKEPADRVQSVAELARNLRRFKRESSRQRKSRATVARPAVKGDRKKSVVATEPGLKKFLWPGITAFLSVLLVFMGWLVWESQRTPQQSLMRFSISLSPGEALDFSGGNSSIALSPDGRYLVYISYRDGTPQLFLRAMDQLKANPIAGTEFALDPFFSPDGQWIGFFTQLKLSKVPVFGGAPQSICETGSFPRSGWWSGDGNIYFGTLNRAIYKVNANGGTPVPVTVIDSSNGEISHRYPATLPGDNVILFTVKYNNIATFDEAVVIAQRLDTGERTTLIKGGTYARYVSTGHLIYGRGKSLYAIPFDAAKLEITGSPAHLLDGGMVNQFSGSANFDLSQTGILAYVPGGPIPWDNTVISWADRQGNIRPLLDKPGPYAEASLSPDEQKIALTVFAANDDIWIYQIPRGTLTRLTFGGGNHSNPIWNPDGKRVVYNAEMGGVTNLYWKSWDGSAAEERLTESTSGQFPNSFSPDGKFLAYSQDGDIWILPMDQERKPFPFLKTQFNEDNPSISPDGRYLAYTSNESGRGEIYVVPFPGRGGKWQISIGGGFDPAWSRNGKELFYLTGTGNTVMVVDVNTQQFNLSMPRKLFELPASGLGVQAVSGDGKRFVVGLSRAQQLTTTEVHVVLGWFGELKEKFSSDKLK